MGNSCKQLWFESCCYSNLAPCFYWCCLFPSAMQHGKWQMVTSFWFQFYCYSRFVLCSLMLSLPYTAFMPFHTLAIVLKESHNGSFFTADICILGNSCFKVLADRGKRWTRSDRKSGCGVYGWRRKGCFNRRRDLAFSNCLHFLRAWWQAKNSHPNIISSSFILFWFHRSL